MLVALSRPIDLAVIVFIGLKRNWTDRRLIIIIIIIIERHEAVFIHRPLGIRRRTHDFSLHTPLGAKVGVRGLRKRYPTVLLLRAIKVANASVGKAGLLRRDGP